MLCDMVRRQEQLTILLPQTCKEHFSSPPSAQSFNLFPETHENNSEVASSSNGDNEGYSSNPISVSYVLYNNNTTTNNNRNNNNNENTNDLSLVFDSPGEGIGIASNNIEDGDNLSLVFDSSGEIENDIVSASIDFNHSTYYYTSPHFLNNQQQQQFDFSSLNNQNIHEANDILTNNSLNHQYNNIVCPPIIPNMTTSSLLTHSFENESNATIVPSYTQLNPTIQCYNLPNFDLGTYMSPTLPIDDNSMNLTKPSSYYDLAPQDINFHVGNNLGNNFPDTVSPVFHCKDDLKVFTNENQHLIKGHYSSTPLTLSEIVSHKDESSSFKVEKLSVQERKEKIKKYMKKRNERNFNKKIKYACRKTLADSRPRVRGRFVKNDDLIEAANNVMITHEEYTYEDVRVHIL
ncbi:hypothetical protein Leryth_016782 [Lithospermum erythrorhizon]|nr:hypothetical protein Leryth_016782 [Lithospermum erythrorhizon]